MPDEILLDEGKSPVDNLPVAAGKKRRGRPKKVRMAESGATPDGEGSPPPADLVSEVKGAISKALEKKKQPGALTRKGIVGLSKQVARSEVSKALRSELRNREVSAGVADQVREAITNQDANDALTTQHGQQHPFWHLLRNR